MSKTIEGGYYLSEQGKPVDANGKPIAAVTTLPEDVNAFTLDAESVAVARSGPAVRYEKSAKGGWYTAYDADGNEVGKEQGEDVFFAAFPGLKEE